MNDDEVRVVVVDDLVDAARMLAMALQLDGYEVARRIRLLPGLQQVLLLALTGYGQQQDCAAATAAGFDHHFVKPANPESLVAFIEAHAPGAGGQASGLA